MANFMACRLPAAYQMQPGQTVTPPLDLSISAMIDDGTDDPSYGGSCFVRMQAEGIPAQIAMLFDQNGQPLPTFQTGPFHGGQWTGKVAFRPTGPSMSGGSFCDVAVEAVDLSGWPAGGTRNSLRIYFASAPPIPTSLVTLYNQGQVVYSQSLNRPVDLRLTLDGAMIFPPQPLFPR